MTLFTDRTAAEQEIIRLAYEFEMEAIRNLDPSDNPYGPAIRDMVDGAAVWEALNEAVEMAF